MDQLEQRLANLSPEQRRLVEHWMQKKQQAAAPAAQPGEIPRRGATDASPLSFAQQRLWFLHQLEPASPAYNLRTAVRLIGRLDVAALVRSLNAIRQRHEVLRTTFPAVDGQPRQVIAPTWELPVPVVPLDHLPPDEREAELQRLMFEATEQPFDMAREPPLRVRLLRMRPDEHVLLFVKHHIISDAWSQGVQLRELMALYAADVAGRPAPLPALSIQYADYAAWQRDTFQSAGLEKQLRYWKQQLEHAPPVLELPTDHPRPPVATYRGAWDYYTIPAAVLIRFKEQAQRAGATLFMALLAAFDVLLYRYTGQGDIVVGTPVAGRNRAELEGLIGCFVNMLPLRTRLDGELSFAQLLLRVRTVALEAYAHQDLPLGKLVEELQLARDLSRNPIFQVMLVLQNTPLPALEAAGLRLQPMEVTSTSSTLDLTLYTRELAQELQVRVEYSTDLFDNATIHRMLGHFRALLEGIVADSQRRIAELPLLTGPERRQLLSEWNDTRSEVRSQESGVRSSEFEARLLNADSWLLNADNCIQELFEAQAARSPDAVAVIFDSPTNDERRGSRVRGSGVRDQDGVEPVAAPWSLTSDPCYLSYATLNRRANQLARHLTALGVGLETLVGLCAERSCELVIGLLGILKAGGAYLPLDPAYPAARLAFMLDDAQVGVLITAKEPDKETRRQGDKEHFDLRVSPSPGLLVSRTVVDLRADWPVIARQPAENPAHAVSPDQLAYVIYTSGSTGRPKGVLGLQRGILNRAHWMWRAYPFAAGDRCCLKTSLSFVDAVWELFGPLVQGVPLVLIPEATVKDPHQLVALLACTGVTRLVLVPSLLQALLDAQPSLARHVPRLKYWISSGEALSVELAQRFRAALPNATLLNLYGSSEVAADALSHEAQRSEMLHTVPIGRPIANTQVYLLDRALQPVPIGVTGELYVGGAGLARGYLGRPGLTAERFVPNPFARVSGIRSQVSEDTALNTQHPTPDTRLYKTGDHARYLPSGIIEYLGRRDQQIKLRGYRVELGEIAAALRVHPHVRAAAVLAREDTPGDTRLVAYVVPAQVTGDREQGTGVRSQETEVRSQSTTADDTNPKPSSIVHRPLSSNEEGSDSSFVLRLSSFVSDLRAFLATRLPAYMIPAAFVLLDALPLTPQGKLDRQALLHPAGAASEQDVAAPGPRTPLESKLVQIWEEVLGVRPIGVTDDFFARGGHSLLALRLMARIAQQFGRQLPLSVLFKASTIEQLAALLQGPADA